MSTHDWIFFSPEETLSAIRRDFAQYTPQTSLFLELSPLILGENTSVVEDCRNNVLWMADPGHRSGQRMQRIAPAQFGTLLCNHLENSRPPPPVLANICSRIFRTPARPGTDTSGQTIGIWINTEMQDFQCRQCGNCCRALDYHDLLTEADVRMWKEKKRNDILTWVAVWGRNGKTSYTIWVEPGTRRYAAVCPWLDKTAENRWACLIHDVKPAFCRNYPGTRKHAEMTGCEAFGS